MCGRMVRMSISKGLAESAVVGKVIYKEAVESLKQCVVADVEEERTYGRIWERLTIYKLLTGKG